MVVTNLVKNVPVFYGIRGLIAVFTWSLQLFPFQSQIIPLHAVLSYFFKIHIILVSLLIHVFSVIFFCGFPHQYPPRFSLFSVYNILLNPSCLFVIKILKNKMNILICHHVWKRHCRTVLSKSVLMYFVPRTNNE